MSGDRSLEDEGYMSGTTGQKPMEAVREVLELARGTLEPLKAAPGYSLRFHKDEGVPARGVALVLADQSRFVFYLELDALVPESARQRAAEFITRANFETLIGNFEMDFDSGAIRYKTDVDFQGAQLLPVLVRNCLVNALDSLERYYDAMNDVIAGRKSPRVAVEEADSN